MEPMVVLELRLSTVAKVPAIAVLGKLRASPATGTPALQLPAVPHNKVPAAPVQLSVDGTTRSSSIST